MNTTMNAQKISTTNSSSRKDHDASATSCCQQQEEYENDTSLSSLVYRSHNRDIVTSPMMSMMSSMSSTSNKNESDTSGSTFASYCNQPHPAKKPNATAATTNKNYHQSATSTTMSMTSFDLNDASSSTFAYHDGDNTCSGSSSTATSGGVIKNLHTTMLNSSPATLTLPRASPDANADDGDDDDNEEDGDDVADLEPTSESFILYDGCDDSSITGTSSSMVTPIEQLLHKSYVISEEDESATSFCMTPPTRRDKTSAWQQQKASDLLLGERREEEEREEDSSLPPNFARWGSPVYDPGANHDSSAEFTKQKMPVRYESIEDVMAPLPTTMSPSKTETNPLRMPSRHVSVEDISLRSLVVDGRLGPVRQPEEEEEEEEEAQNQAEEDQVAVTREKKVDQPLQMPSRHDSSDDCDVNTAAA